MSMGRHKYTQMALSARFDGRPMADPDFAIRISERNPAREVPMFLPEGFDPALLEEIQEKYGVEIVATESVQNEDDDVVQNSPFHDFHPRALAKIANKLDASSFVALAMTCNHLFNFYHQPSAVNKVEVPLQWDEVHICVEGREGVEPVLTCRSELKDIDFPGEMASEYVASLQKWPFTGHIKELVFDRYALPMLEEVFKKMSADSIDKIRVCGRVKYTDVLDLIDTYHVKSASWMYEHERYSAEQTRALLSKPLDCLWIPHVQGNLLRDVTIPKLHVRSDGNLNRTDLSAIIQNFLTSDTLISWHFFDNIESYDFTDCFKESVQLDLGYTGPLPQIRPLAFCSSSQAYILRADGRVFKVESRLVKITFPCPSKLPSIFARF